VTSFLDRLLGRPEPPKSAKAVTALGAWGTSYPLSLSGNTEQAKAGAYLKAYSVGWFHKAGSKISGDFANLPWHISDGDIESDDPNEATLDKPDLLEPFERLSPIDQLQRLMEKPNPFYSGRVLRQKSWIRHKFGGLGILYLEGGAGGGLPTAIYGISPARMWPSYNKAGTLIGWVMDKDAPSGGVPFDAQEIVAWSAGTPDDSPFGVSVVQAIYSQVPLTDLMARHTANVLTTGGRLAGMMWPKERALSEDEFLDAQRAWRNVASDPDAGKRLLIFPEPMEYAQGASTPAEIGIPELAALNRDEILTGFNLSPYRLGVPAPGGLNSGEVRREDRRDYWEDAVGPEVTTWDEVVNTYIVSRYEEVLGQSFVYTTEQPNLDDAPTLLGKTEAFKSLVAIGLDPRESLKVAGLSHVKWLGLPELIDPAAQAEAARQAAEAAAERPAPPPPAKSIKAAAALTVRDRVTASVVTEAKRELGTFFDEQRERVTANLRRSLPAAKGARIAAIKADPTWWDGDLEDRELSATIRGLYVRVGRGALQVAVDELGRIMMKNAVEPIVADLLANGGQRIKDINARTLQALTIELSEGTRRGYSIPQLIEGVPAEGYRGVLGVTLENGTPVFGDLRAETIARTETALSYNRASVLGYEQLGVTEFLAYDGDDDPECAERNGQTYSAEEAAGIEDHPNGTLVFSPVVDKSWHEPPQNITVSPVINVSLPPTSVTNEVKTPNVQVAAPQVSVTNDVQTPYVKVEAPTVNVRNDVQTPTVNVQNDVKMPATKAVNPTINVSVPADLRITSMPDRLTKRVVKREKGVITETTDVETDA
jgi:hypothetical protein